MKSSREIGKSILQVASGEFIGKSLALGITFVLAKMLSVTDFGTYNFLLSKIALLSIIPVTYSNAYLQKSRLGDNIIFERSIFYEAIVLQIGLVLIVSIFTEFSSIVLIGTIGFTLFALLRVFYNLQERYIRYGLVTVLQQVGALLGTILFLLFWRSPSAEILLFGNIFVGILLVLVFFNVDTIATTKSVRGRFSFGLLREYKLFILYYLFMNAFSFSDQYFVRELLGMEELGLYSFSLKMYNISMFGIGPLLAVIRIRQIDLVKKSSNIKQFLKAHQKRVFALSMILGCCLYIGFQILVEFIFQDYRHSLNSTNILLLSSMISYNLLPFSFLLAQKRFKLIVVISAISLVLNIILNIQLIPFFGMLGAACATLVGHLFLNGLNVYYSLRS